MVAQARRSAIKAHAGNTDGEPCMSVVKSEMREMSPAVNQEKEAGAGAAVRDGERRRKARESDMRRAATPSPAMRANAIFANPSSLPSHVCEPCRQKRTQTKFAAHGYYVRKPVDARVTFAASPSEAAGNACRRDARRRKPSVHYDDIVISRHAP